MKKPKAKVVTSAPNHHLRFDRKNAVVGIVVLLLLVAAASWWLAAKDEPREVSKTPAKEVVSDALFTKEGASRQQLEDALAQSPSDQERRQLYQLLANKAYEEENYRAAAAYLERAYEAGSKEVMAAQSIAVLYLEKLKDKEVALKYFILARDHLRKNPDMPYAEQLGKALESEIKKLEDEGVTASE